MIMLARFYCNVRWNRLFFLGGLFFRACLCSCSCAACVCVARFVLSLLLALFGAFYDRTCVVHGLAETGVGVVFHCVCVCFFNATHF